MKRTSLLHLVLTFVALLCFAAFISGCKKPRRTNLPHGNNVEYVHGAKILTQRFAERDELHYYLSDLKLTPSLIINGKTESGHSFEFESSASCKLSKPPPDKLVLTLLHDIAQRSKWHFPPPKSSDNMFEPNASFDLTVLADGQRVMIPGLRQSKLQKDAPSDATFYETLILELPREDFVRIANSRSAKIELGSFASFELDDRTLAALKAYITTVSDTEPWP